jgi:hypothetical protein
MNANFHEGACAKQLPYEFWVLQDGSFLNENWGGYAGFDCFTCLECVVVTLRLSRMEGALYVNWDATHPEVIATVLALESQAVKFTTQGFKDPSQRSFSTSVF